MEHHFDIDEAQRFGVNEAIFLHNLKFWITHNMANDLHNHEDKTWTYNSRKALSQLFPYWSESQVRRITASLIENKVIKISSFNKARYDHTLWYTIIDSEVLAGIKTSLKASAGLNCRNRQIEGTKSSNQIDEIVTPIPDRKLQIENTDITLAQKRATIAFDLFYDSYPKKAEKKRAKSVWSKLNDEKRQLAIDGIIRFTANKEKRFISSAAVYLSGERWEDEATERTVDGKAIVLTGSQKLFKREIDTKPRARPKQSLRESLNQHRRQSS